MMKLQLRDFKTFSCLMLAASLSACDSASHKSNDSAANLHLAASPMERITITDAGFVQVESGRAFQPWGLNYGHHGKLMEDFWDKDWNTLASDFRKMKALGANVVRVHLQFGKFMDAPDKPNAHALKQYARLLDLAAQTGIYLDVTGLACYRPSDSPAWCDALDETNRWAAQARFWEIIAATGNSNPAIFCYDLMNEPFVAGGARKHGEWRSGVLLGHGTNAFDFIQFINLDAAGRNREDIARQWVGRMVAAIRSQDRRTLITVGQLPWGREWHHLSGFDPAKIKDDLDFISVHIYPDSKKPDEAMQGLRQFAVGKPIVIEETFPLTCDAPQLEKFLRASRSMASGWMGHFDGDSLEELDALDHKKISNVQAVYRSWLQLFVKLGPEFAK